MMTSKISGKGARLGTRMRGKLAAPYDDRGHHLSNLWYVYSPKMRADVVLRSDLEWAHYVFAESDPDVVVVDYSPTSEVARVGDQDIGTTLDAIVTFRNGVVEWREIKRSEDVDSTDVRVQAQFEGQLAAAARVHARYRRLTEKEIFVCPQRISNWSRVLAWLSAVRGRALVDEQNTIATLIHVRGVVSVADIIAASGDSDSACLIAAAFKGVQDGLYRSDLDEHPLSGATIISGVRD